MGHHKIFWWGFLVVQCLLYFSTAKSELPVAVSRGAYLVEVRNVIINTHSELLTILLPDLPAPPRSITSHTCPDGASEKSCDIADHVLSLVDDTSESLLLLNKGRTSFGLEFEQLNLTGMPPLYSTLPIPEKPERADPPSDELVVAAGKPWFEQLKIRVEERSFTPQQLESLFRNRRWIATVMKPLAAIAAVMGTDDLISWLQRLFVPENSIIRFLTTLQALNPAGSLIDISKTVSEFEQSSKKQYLELLKDSKYLKDVTQKLQQDVKAHHVDLTVINDGYILTQQLLTDVAANLYTSTIYFSYYHSFAVCRSNFIPSLFMPPHLLEEKLRKVEEGLPSEDKLAIPIEEFHRYFTLPLSHCIYDSNGGLMVIEIPLVPKASDFKLYEFKSIAFAYESMTCTLPASSQYLIKNIATNQVFSIEDVSAEECAVKKTRRCKVPQVGGDDSLTFCLSMLLSSSTLAQVIEACPLSCVESSRPILSQISDVEFIGVHIPPNSASIHCDNHEIVNITERVIYGSLRILVSCQCHIYFEKRLVGKSIGTGPCSGNEPIIVESYLPGHMTTLTNFLPFTGSGVNDVTRFKTMAEVFNPNFIEPYKKHEPKVFTNQISPVAILWNSCQTVAIAFILFKMNLLNMATFTGLANIRGASAGSQQHYCKLNDDLYYLLYVIISLTALAYIPAIIKCVYGFLKSQFWNAVNVQVDRRVMAEVME